MGEIKEMISKEKFDSGRLSIIIVFIFLCLCNMQLSASDFNKATSENQQFVIPENAINGDYLGYVQAFPEYQVLGSSPVFSLKDGVNDTYTLNSNGLITIKNAGNLQAGEDIVNVLVSKNGYQSIENVIKKLIIKKE